MEKVCIFYTLLFMFINKKTMDMLQEKSREEKYPKLEVEEDVYYREKHQKDMLEENIKDTGKVHALRWQVYKKKY